MIRKCQQDKTSASTRSAKHIPNCIWWYDSVGRVFITGRKVMSLQVNALNQSEKATRFFRKRHIKTVFTNNVAEHAKSRMGNARTRPR